MKNMTTAQHRPHILYYPGTYISVWCPFQICDIYVVCSFMVIHTRKMFFLVECHISSSNFAFYETDFPPHILIPLFSSFRYFILFCSLFICPVFVYQHWRQDSSLCLMHEYYAWLPVGFLHIQLVTRQYQEIIYSVFILLQSEPNHQVIIYVYSYQKQQTVTV